MIFSSRARILYKKDDSKYVILDVEYLDTIYGVYYVRNEEKAMTSVPSESDVVLKQYVLTTDRISNNDNSKYLFSGDIINVKRGKINRDYEIVISNGEVKGRELESDFLIDIGKLLKDDRTDATLTTKHRNKEGEIIDLYIDAE